MTDDGRIYEGYTGLYGCTVRLYREPVDEKDRIIQTMTQQAEANAETAREATKAYQFLYAEKAAIEEELRELKELQKQAAKERQEEPLKEV